MAPIVALSVAAHRWLTPLFIALGRKTPGVGEVKQIGKVQFAAPQAPTPKLVVEGRTKAKWGGKRLQVD